MALIRDGDAESRQAALYEHIVLAAEKRPDNGGPDEAAQRQR
ncbi:hypothetical protein [Salinactinospora qingdaonensis]|uniref:GntR family transcriptional regulator n=1 Tax=Salinactinospora qingdaonensis TaxID=702744 RepID=A0ABP7FV20_9ACTN